VEHADGDGEHQREVDAATGSAPAPGTDGMDPGFVLALFEPRPQVVEVHAVVMTGALLPVALPTAWLPPHLRARFFLDRTDLPLAERVAAAFALGREADAWRLLAACTIPLSDAGIEAVVSPWRNAAGRRLGVDASRDALVVVPMPGARLVTPVGQGGLALAKVRELFASLPLPRWLGAVVVVPDRLVVEGLPADRDLLSRAVLPLVRLPRPRPGAASEGEDLAELLTRLTLALAAPPRTGWPPWLETGLARIARVRVRGDEQPSPRDMLAVRMRAGPAAIRALFSATTPDSDLAMAVCAPLAHTHRRPQLGGFLDMLRNGLSAETALDIAYGLSADQLASGR